MFIKSSVCFVSAILLMHLSSAAATPAVDPNMLRIVGGEATTIESVPYMVQIWKGADFLCGGTLVSELHVVTAAQCVEGSTASDFTIVGGATRLDDVGERRGVALIMKPPGYSKTNRKMDVAVLKLDSEMTGDDISTIELNDVPLVRGQVLHVSGWGLKSEYVKNPSGEVRHMFVPIIPRATCETQYKGIQKIESTMFCAAKPGVMDHCYGDTGGPAVCDGKFCGIISTAVGCARVNRPGIYIGVRAVSSFILQSMNK